MSEIYVPHVGWLSFEDGDEVAEHLNRGWFEYGEQAFLWIFLRPGDRIIDCGAHVGLFSVLASRATNGNVHILAIEPNPSTLKHLRHNLQCCEAKNVEIIEGALSSESGKTQLSVGKAGKSAYSSVAIEVSENSVTVDAFTVDDLLESRNIETVEFMKIDVEGAENAVLSGASKSVIAGRLPVVMIEFTEQNLNQVGMSTSDLRSAWEAFGYQFCQFDAKTLRVSPYSFDGPIAYENLLAVKDIGAVNRKLQGADDSNCRIAKEIVNRCETAKNLIEGYKISRANVASALAKKSEAYRELQNSKRVKFMNKLLLPLDRFRARRNR